MVYRMSIFASIIMAILNPSMVVAAESDTIALWHSYNEPIEFEDVLDSTGHGCIGEFNDADKFLVSRRNKDYAIRLYGEFEKGRCLGYRIMPSERLALNDGAISCWICIDPDIETAKGIILSIDKTKYLAVSNGRNGVRELSATFGKRISARIEGEIGRAHV